MIFIKALLFLLAVYVALLVPKYELRFLDGYWCDTSDDVFSLRDHGSAASEIAMHHYMCPLCSAVAPWEDDEADDE